MLRGNGPIVSEGPTLSSAAPIPWSLQPRRRCVQQNEVGPLTPHPGTPLYRTPRRAGALWQLSLPCPGRDREVHREVNMQRLSKFLKVFAARPHYSIEGPKGLHACNVPGCSL